MSRYFTPLRTKLGVVTLVVACVSTCAWMRSFWTRDTLQIYGGEQHAYFLVSDRSWLYWQCSQQKFGWQRNVPLMTMTMTTLAAQKSLESPPLVISVVILIKGKREMMEWGTTTIGGVPFFAIILPLLLLSGWLMLPKAAISEPKVGNHAT